MIKVFLVDDHEVVRRGIAVLLSAETDIEVVGEAASVAQALARIPAANPDVLVLDVRLPDGSGIDVCRQLNESSSPIRSLLLTSYDDDEAVHVDLAGYPVCLVRSGGAYYAMLDECSHGHVELSEGEVEDGFVECWLHGSRFDLDTGIPACPPATEPVPVFEVRTDGEGVEVALPPSPPT